MRTRPLWGIRARRSAAILRNAPDRYLNYPGASPVQAAISFRSKTILGDNAEAAMRFRAAEHRASNRSIARQARSWRGRDYDATKNSLELSVPEIR